MLCAASLSADDQKAMRSTNDIKKARKILPVERPSDADEESHGRGTATDGEEAALSESRESSSRSDRHRARGLRDDESSEVRGPRRTGLPWTG